MMIQRFPFPGFLGVCLSENFIADKRLGFSRVGEAEDSSVQENLIGFLVASFFSSFSL
jgi:hypothetical protein